MSYQPKVEGFQAVALQVDYLSGQKPLLNPAQIAALKRCATRNHF